MSQRDDYEPGVPCWIDTLQPDPEATMAFYGALFGWEFAGPGAKPGDPRAATASARMRGRDVAGVGSQPAGGPAPPPGWTTYVYVESADETAERGPDAGGAVLVEPFDVLRPVAWPSWPIPAAPPFGAWEPGERRGAQLVNEPGAWAMSHLEQPGSRARRGAFYGALFGWTTETFGEGDDAMTMFRLPGYVGGEPQQPVSREVIATMSAVRGDGAPGWTVNLWDHDVDATRRKAVELGGRALAAPFDTPMTRMAVLADPLRRHVHHQQRPRLRREAPMAKLTVINHVTLDGVMQAPARPDEDVRDGFQHGGWALPYGDSVMAEFMGKGMAKGGALLFGRRTYEDFAAVWPEQEGNPISALLERAPEVRGVDDAARATAMGQLHAAAGRRRGGGGRPQGGPRRGPGRARQR